MRLTLARLSFGAALMAGLLAAQLTAAASSAQAPTSQWVEALRNRLTHPEPGDVITIAHRACWKDTAENSLSGVKRCIEMGVDGVEFDVRHTRDGVAVILHDETVDRTTNGHGPVSSLTFRQIQTLQLRAGAGGSGSPLTLERVPTLEQYLEAAKGRLLLVFDVKDQTQAESFHVAKSVGVDRQAIFFYECRSRVLLDRIRGFWGQVVVFPIAFQADGPLATSMERCPSHPAGLIHTKWSQDGFLEAAVEQSRSRHERLWIATMLAQDVAGHSDQEALIDPDAAWGRQIDVGANMIMTNEPGALLAYLRRRSSGNAR